MTTDGQHVWPNRDGIWAELTGLDRWVGWRNECRECDKILDPGIKECPDCGEKTTKRPINANTGRRAKASDPDNIDRAKETWTDFETAWEYYESHDDIHGVGFVFYEGDQITGIDLDDCRDPETGEIEPWAVDIVRTLGGATEISPSGTGIHIYVFGEVPEGGNRRDGVEMYDVERYFTVTGARTDHSAGSLTWRQEEIDTVHEGHVYSESTAAAADVDFTIEGGFEERASYSNELGESLEEIRDRDERLDYLLESIEADYQSASEADMAAATKLWFWRFGLQDIADIIRQFRTRPKVIDRNDYLELTISKVAAGEQYDPRSGLDEDVEILGDRDVYSSISETELPDGHFVLDKPPREGGSHASIEHLTRDGASLVILVSRHSIAKHHLEILGQMVPDSEAAVHLVGSRRACDNPDAEECPNAPASLEEKNDLENRVIDILYRKSTVTIDDCPEGYCKYSFIKKCEERAMAVVTVPQLLSGMGRNFEEDNLLIDEEQALAYFRPGSSELVEVGQRYEPDGHRTVQVLSSNIGTQYRALESIKERIFDDQQQRQEEADAEGRGWRRKQIEIDLVNAIEYVEDVKRVLGVSELEDELTDAGLDVTSKAVIDEIISRLNGLERPEPRCGPDTFREEMAKYVAPYFHQDDVDPGGFIESVLFAYDDRPFDFKKTGGGHTIRIIGGRSVFYNHHFREFDQIGIIAGPEGELLFDDLGLDATTVIIDQFRYADDFVVIPIAKESKGELERAANQRRRSKRVSEMLNRMSHPHIAVAGTKERAESHHADLNQGMADVVGNPESPAKDLRTLWSAGQTSIMYANSAVSRGIDAPFFDVTVVVSSEFATPYWEARTKHYRGEDEDEYARSAAIESQLKARELTNAVLRQSPTRGTDDICGTKFIVVSDWDSYRLKYLQDRKIERFAYAENAANFARQLTIPGGLRHTIDEIYEEVGGSERAFIEITMEEELTETVYRRPSFTLDELIEWRENWWLTSGDDLETMKKVVPMGGDPMEGKQIRDTLAGWNGGRIMAALKTLERKGLFNSFTEDDGSRGRPPTYWQWDT